jgi:hypothetical protein
MRSSIRVSFSAALLGSFVALLGGCGTAPLSYLNGDLLDRSTLNRYPVRIVSVDGQIEFHNPVQVAPGQRWVVVEAAPSAGVKLMSQQSFVLKVEPCTRYYLAADRRSPLTDEWQLVVERTEPVGSCNPQEELRKAGQPS